MRAGSCVVRAVRLRKSFVVSRSLRGFFGGGRKICALDGVSFELTQGRVLGVVGSNGAGKTTLIRILADLVEADEGIVEICGREVGINCCNIRGMIGYVSSDERSFFWRLSGRENLEFFGRLYGLDSRQARKKTAEILEEFGFADEAGRRFGEYSAGMRKKVSIMRALLHRPKVLLLDELTDSLDAISAEMVRGLVRRYVCEKTGRAAVWSTHRYQELEQVCDEVIRIEDGRICYRGEALDGQ